MQYIKICPECKKTGLNLKRYNSNDFPDRFLECRKGIIGIFHTEWVNGETDDLKICPYCNNSLLDTKMELDDYGTITLATDSNRQVLDSMIELAKNDPIEYALKIDQFRLIAERKAHETLQKARERLYGSSIPTSSNQPKCPTCGSANVHKISMSRKVVGGALFGLFSSSVRNTMECGNCGYKW